MNSDKEELKGEIWHAPSFEIVHGTPVALTAEEVSKLDGTFGVPQRVAEEVSRQILAAIVERDLRPEDVCFSGYSDAEDVEHQEKSTGDFAGENGVHEYFFTNFDALTDGAEGPLAYAATDVTPAVGVYSRERLLAAGYNELHGVASCTPQALAGTLLFEFRPRYLIES
jgi:hypothetical protein